MRVKTANNPKLGTEILNLLAVDPEPDIRRVVAQHPNTSFQTLQHLALDRNPSIRLKVEERDDLTAEQREKINKILLAT